MDNKIKITHFEETGLRKANAFIEVNYFDHESPSRIDLIKILKTSSVFISVENLNRFQSTLLCELNDSYVQQSQRYVSLEEDSYSLPSSLSTTDLDIAKTLMDRSLSLYERMTEINGESLKGRPTAKDYKYGIPIEDARYILPLAVNTNLTMSMSGDKLIDLFELFLVSSHSSLLSEFRNLLLENIPSKVANALYQVFAVELLPKKTATECFHKDELDKITVENKVVLLEASDLDFKVGIGALTSTCKESPFLSAVEMQENSKLTGLVERVLSYGHKSISEQARLEVGLMMSMVTYHQFIRHRINNISRESLSSLIKDECRSVIIPLTIQGSPFLEEYERLVADYKQFRVHLLDNYILDVAPFFILNCDQIKVVSTSNARAYSQMMSERICLNAQWEIRELFSEMLVLFRGNSGILFEDSLPSCVYGKCKEGKLSCGKAKEVRAQWINN